LHEYSSSWNWLQENPGPQVLVEMRHAQMQNRPLSRKVNGIGGWLTHISFVPGPEISIHDGLSLPPSWGPFFRNFPRMHNF
jgi:hypothetical protein